MGSVHNYRITGIILLLLLFVCGVCVSPAQQRATDIRFRLAQSYERSGDLESAVRLLLEITGQDSLNVVINESLRRDLIQLKRYDEAITVISRMLRKNPADLPLRTELGTAMFLKSDQAAAQKIWNDAVALDPNHETTYRIVGGAMVQNRLFDRAIELYQKARSVLHDPTLFAFDIGYLYGVTMNYSAATKEYLALIRQNPGQMGFVQSHIAQYTAQTDALSSTISVVEEAVGHDPGILPFRQLLAWCYLEARDFTKAYTVYQYLDKATNAGGHELQRFADRASHERAYASAAAAYQDILSKYPSFDRAADVKYGYALALESAASSGKDTLRIFGRQNPFSDRKNSAAVSQALLDAIHAYERVIKDHPGTQVAAQSALRVGIIRQEEYGDAKGAQEEFQGIERRYGAYPAITVEAKLRLGDVMVVRGDLGHAAEEFRSLAASGSAQPDIRSRAILELARLDYYAGRFDTAVAALKSLSRNTLSDAANDAIELQIFIQDNRRTGDTALQSFAAADLLRRQTRLPEAVTKFEAIVTAWPKSEIIDETLIAIGDIYAAMSRFPQAIASYDRLRTDYPESMDLDRTLMKEGEVYEFGLRDSAKASACYEQLLAKFPNSIYTSEARRQIRIIRGDSI